MAPIIVDTDWIADRLEDSAIAIVDVRQPYFYGQGHIPGALSLPDYHLFGPGGAPPPAGNLAARLGELGITPGTHVVACDDGGSYSAARLYWVLTYYRHEAVSVLDGGVTKWRHEGRDWEYSAATPVALSSDFGAPNPAVLADLDTVKTAIGAPDAVLLDVRSPAEYLGLQPAAARNGHVPGAINIDWVNNLERANGTYYHFRPREDLRALYETAGVTKDKDVVIYCQAGGRAAAAFLALKELGYPDVRMYPPGWQEWGNRDDTPIEEE